MRGVKARGGSGGRRGGGKKRWWKTESECGRQGSGGREGVVWRRWRDPCLAPERLQAMIRSHLREVGGRKT
ncbi:hypothetical protein E2C01_063011 [Portunus trituberculatus]|uniref:Uncharacterized protein n=1 Tax=Portunus trituberculatus TaxID=210409 RepID=A0A5B7H831_PORTR|nr:hypothetical protein [Portunus trituberculatus]